MAAPVDYLKIDLYDILGVLIDASEKDIVKAYRKKALKYHPDKNSDPAAVDIFHKLSKALEVLTDSAARAAYDKVLKAKAAAEIRNKQRDAKRQKLRDDLIAREQAGQTASQRKAQEAKDLEREVERLRKEGSSLLEKEQALLREELAKQAKQAKHTEEQQRSHSPEEPIRIKLKWRCSKTDVTNGGYNSHTLTQLFSKYGRVGTVLVSGKKNGSAILEFETSSLELLSAEREGGLKDCPLSVSWISGKPSRQTKTSLPQPSNLSTDRLLGGVSADNQSTSSVTKLSSSLTSDCDFEDLVLMRMRQAEERRRIIEQMKCEEDTGQEKGHGQGGGNT